MQVPKAVRIQLEGAGHHFHVHVSSEGKAKVTCMLATITSSTAPDDSTVVCTLPLGGTLGTWQGTMPLRSQAHSSQAHDNRGGTHIAGRGTGCMRCAVV
jgi:hypothetical protein